MKWVTWEGVGVDRMACAWLIERFIDADAEFSFVPYGESPDAGDGRAFDIPGIGLAHRKGNSTFHTLLDEYRLADPVLWRIARMVDEADTVQDASVEPAAAGLDLLCRGLRLTSPDDTVALERGRLLYDALYAQIRQDMTAR